MTSEFDLPCSACGGDLREVAIDPCDLGIEIETDVSVLVAKCRVCGERHYPEQTLSDLGRHASLRS
ncbi:hypothetical protein [Halosolutus gelatinilyticus]|uniref:hypothetical protein n=1 Tax=Halosolutus gelatinilyticus TaxID=2931975 RepID=UPI001FF64FA9|nr:hypothetical protein [Halosolutus gelatinilyticus]